MTTLRIEHLTSYFYSQPVAFGEHRLVLRPREGHDVRVLEMQLDITPAHRLLWSRDVFGNSIALVDFVEPADKLEIRSEVVIQRLPPFSTEDPAHDGACLTRWFTIRSKRSSRPRIRRCRIRMTWTRCIPGWKAN